VATGLAVLAGFTRIKDPYANFKDPFAGSTSSANSLVTAFVRPMKDVAGLVSCDPIGQNQLHFHWLA